MQHAEDEGQTKVYESHRSLEEKHTLHEMIAEGEGVAVRTTCSRVHSSEPLIPVKSAIFSGRKPSGRSCTVRHIHFYRWVGRKLTEQWGCRDDLGEARATGLELKPSSDAPGS